MPKLLSVSDVNIYSDRYDDADANARDDVSGLDEDAESSSLFDNRDVTFAELGVPEPLVRVLAADGKTTAFPIQVDTLPDSLAGRDLLGRGQTGSGKTLAFAIPLVTRLSQSSGSESAIRSFEHWREHGDSRSKAQALLPRPRGLVLAPTRELVNQIDEVIAPLARAYHMTTTTIYGGVNQNRQVSALRDGADIIVACPGRLEDLLHQRLLSLDSVEITVLDEADEMADMGFLPAVSRLLEQVDGEGQHMLFSATLDHGVDKLVRRFLTDARIHSVDSAESHVDTMTHHVFAVSQGNKHEVIRILASGMGKRILFTRTKYQAKKMAKKLVDGGIPAVDLQGNLSQNQRDRHLAAFTDGEVRVLVATDVAARGIDVSDVELVVQTEPPEDPKSFLHRSGRTARAGESGDVVTLVLPEQHRDARDMLRRAGIHVHSVEVTPASPELDDLVGEHAPLVKGWALSAPAQQQAGSGNGSKRRRGARNGSAHRGPEYGDGRGSRNSRGSRAGTGGRGGSRRDDFDYDQDGRGGSRDGGHRRRGAHDDRRDERHNDYFESDQGDRRGATRGERAGSNRRGSSSARNASGRPSRTASGFRHSRGGKGLGPFRNGR
ncbi:DEAD/DEAH box helicase [Bifidobacterium sp.]|uniref:DEAD/DEAH box helicase n=1 Tax=Bifidobacterium sp. TaxID=41200 RepID=UPI003DAA17C5